MNLVEYVPLAVRTEKVLPTLDRFVHGCLGLITEIGEVTTELKRMSIYGKPLDVERKAHIMEEVGDVMWYVAIILDALQADLEYVRQAPRMEMPKDASETGARYDALALMLGVHCGRVCGTVQEWVVNDGVDGFEVPRFIASLTMIINGMYVLSLFCESTLDVAMAHNIAKLRIRFPNAFSEAEAEARADKAGADARVS